MARSSKVLVYITLASFTTATLTSCAPQLIRNPDGTVSRPAGDGAPTVNENPCEIANKLKIESPGSSGLWRARWLGGLLVTAATQNGAQ